MPDEIEITRAIIRRVQKFKNNRNYRRLFKADLIDPSSQQQLKKMSVISVIFEFMCPSGYWNMVIRHTRYSASLQCVPTTGYKAGENDTQRALTGTLCSS